MSRVLNKQTMIIPADAVYIGRGSRWGNPFRIGVDGIERRYCRSVRRGFETNIICCERSES